MRNMRSRLATMAVVVAAAGFSLAAEQNPPQQNTAGASSPPQLQQAATLLNAIDSRAVSSDTARKLQTLRQDFAALQTKFNEQLLNGPAGNTAPGAMSGAGEKDWRVRYSSVESDLRDLIGTDPATIAAGTLPATGAADLDPRMREQLQQFRTSLQTFYASTLGPSQPNPLTPPPAADLRQTSDVFALLNRIEDIVNQALRDTPATASAKPGAATPVGTSGPLTVSGAAGNKVTIERDKLDEIRAEVQQLKVILKK